jgi:hypothetical protein
MRALMHVRAKTSKASVFSLKRIKSVYRQLSDSSFYIIKQVYLQHVRCICRFDKVIFIHYIYILSHKIFIYYIYILLNKRT